MMNNIHASRAAIIVLLSLCVVVTGCSSTDTKPATTNGSNGEPFALKYQNHPLAGKIWGRKEQRFITQAELVKQLAGNDYILLGETHDNSAHHQHQAWIIDKLAALNINAGVAFEMIDNQQGEQLRKTRVTSASQLISLLETGKTGWDYDTYYRPVFDSVFQAGFPIYPANINRNSLMTLLSNGIDRLPEKLKQQLDANPLSEKQKADLEKEINGSHCGMSNPEMTKAMILGQNVRDATMGNSLYDHKHQQGLETMVLVAGSGHVRKDRGVPHYLQSKDPNAKILSIAWLEVYKNADTVEDYTKSWGSTGLPFDYVWFTPQAERPDPCEEMRKFMEKHQKDHGKPTPKTRAI